MAGSCCPHREGTGVAGGCPSPSLPSHSDAADLVVQGKGTFEELMVCSREIAASTAQLVAASKVGARHLGRLLCCCLHHLAAPPTAACTWLWERCSVPEQEAGGLLPWPWLGVTLGHHMVTPNHRGGLLAQQGLSTPLLAAPAGEGRQRQC